MDRLLQRSIAIILANQAPSGAYIASPNFASYRYCWFRDGSFIAYAMDLAGETRGSHRFHAWAARQVGTRVGVIRQAIRKFSLHETLSASDYLYTRYKLDGSDGLEEDWANFQLDGFGTWLWALWEHQRLSGEGLSDDMLTAAGLVAEYLEALWPSPCFDCWEEFPEKVHPYTLAAIFGGLQAHSDLSGADHRATMSAIRSALLEKWTFGGHFVKFAGEPGVDASLLGIAIPYRVFDLYDPLVQATVAEIEATLAQGGGIHRYAADTYYGGGAWVLLTAWLGWYYTEIGDDAALIKARQALEWIERQDQPEGFPEQVPDHLNDPTYYPVWVKRWGKIARPLLWSHANYIILHHNLD
jgi:GH15 family glucan-1,4-alpha-glucosidase